MASAKLHAALSEYVTACRKLGREKTKPRPDIDKRAALALEVNYYFKQYEKLLTRETGAY